ncbi:MAG: RNA polymerase sigma factor [Saccharofermentanales bacterium]
MGIKGSEEINDTISYLEDKEFLDKLYGFAYKRCSTSHEAEDLCSDIVLELLKAIHKNSFIDSFYAFAWKIAHRVYADFSEKRKQQCDRFIAEGFSDEINNIQSEGSPIDDFIESESEAMQLKSIKREIAFLSKIYRDEMVMYYLDEMKIAEIAKRISISETNVKQRLFSARNTVKKEVEKMDEKDLTLQPLRISFIGTGKWTGNDPSIKAERIFSQNLVYLCKNTERSIKELSDILHVPMLFIEEELEIQCKGANGNYGLLRKLENGKYISNFIILDISDYSQVDSLYKKNSDAISKMIHEYFMKNENRILDFPYLNKQNDARFIMWVLISKIIYEYVWGIIDRVKEKYFSDIDSRKRDFYTFGFAVKNNEGMHIGLYGLDGINASCSCGYWNVFISNIYGDRIPKHFACGHNISNDPLLIMTISAIDGIEISSLSEDRKEIAAKAISEGYLKKENDTLYPAILVIDSNDSNAFNELANEFTKEISGMIEPVADELYNCIKKFVPKHLMNEYHLFVQQTSCGLLHDVIEKSIEAGTLYVPEKVPCAEGTLVIVKEVPISDQFSHFDEIKRKLVIEKLNKK